MGVWVNWLFVLRLVCLLALSPATDANGKWPHVERDAAGRRWLAADAGGWASAFLYDGAGRLNWVVTDVAAATTALPGPLPADWFAYTWSARLADSTVTRYRGDALGRLTHQQPDGREAWAAALPPAGAAPLSFTYTAGGQRATMTDASGPTRFAYDGWNRLRLKQTPQGLLYYAYDPAGNLTELSARRTYTFGSATETRFVESALGPATARPAGAHMTYQYEARNRLSKTFADPAATQLAATCAYGTAGELVSVARPGNVTTAFDYNGRYQVRRVRTTTGSTLLACFDYDTAGNAAAVATNRGVRALSPSGRRNRVVDSGPALSARTVDYDYDRLNRLRKETVGASAVTYDSADGYEAGGYDQAGNRRQRAVNGTGFPGLSQQSNLPYDLNDRSDNDATATTPSTFFDANGNQTSDATGTYEYDFLNRLIKAVKGGTTITLVYDGDGNRVQKTVNGVTTWYLVDDRNPTGYAQVLEEQTAPGGTPTVRYVYGLDLVSQTRNTGTAASPVWTTHYHGYDGLGSVRYLTSVSGAVTDTYTYDAFGIQVGSTGAGTPNPYRFTGERWDGDLGMYDLRARYYHPDRGRFWTMDTFEGNPADPLSLHKYLYAHASPVMMVDPSGHESLPGQTVTAGGISGIASWTMTAIQAARARAFFQLTRAYLNADKIIFAFEAGTTALGAGAIIASGAVQLSATALEAVADMTDKVVHSYANNTRHIPAGWSARGLALEQIAGQHLGQAYVGGNVSIIDVFEGNGTKVVASFKSHGLDPSLPDLEGRYIAAFTRDAEAVAEAGNRPLFGTRVDGRPFTLAPGAVDAKIVYAPIPENHSKVLLSSRVTQALRDVAQRTRTIIVPIPTRNWKR